MRYSLRYRFFSFLHKIGINFDSRKNPEVQKMVKALKQLKNHQMVFELEVDKDGNWAAESIDFPGLITGGSANDSFAPLIIDAIFTYFDIPPQYCNDSLLSLQKSKNKQIFCFTNTRLATA